MKSYTCSIYVFLFFLSNFTIAENKIEKKLDLKIPEVNFINKDLKSILDFIKVSSRENDEEGEGVNLILNTIASETKEKPKLINFYAKDIPVGTLIKYVGAQFNLKYKVEKFAIILGDTESLTSLETGFYIINKGLMEFMNRTKYNDSADNQDSKFQKYFKSMGISFPPGARIKFVKKVMRLVVTNTPENHQKIASYLKLTTS